MGTPRMGRSSFLGRGRPVQDPTDQMNPALTGATTQKSDDQQLRFRYLGKPPTLSGPLMPPPKAENKPKKKKGDSKLKIDDSDLDPEAWPKFEKLIRDAARGVPAPPKKVPTSQKD